MQCVAAVSAYGGTSDDSTATTKEGNNTMTDTKLDLCTPWSLHFDRDGTEDYGVICDADGNEIVASHLPERQEGYGNCFWLPEKETDPVPKAVCQMTLMTAAPKLLDMLKIAVATSDPKKHKWIKEAQDAIAEATRQKFNAEEAEATKFLLRASPRLYAALEASLTMLRKYNKYVEAASVLLGPKDDQLPACIEETCYEAYRALAAAKGEKAF
jgi:hypothetical protein